MKMRKRYKDLEKALRLIDVEKFWTKVNHKVFVNNEAYRVAQGLSKTNVRVFL